MEEQQIRKRYSVSLIRQGDNKFYSLSMPSDVLARCCYATSKDEDPVSGFQRTLDESRAKEIAHYIDSEGGTIPSAIILSAQPDANLNIIGQGKTLEFDEDPFAFLIIDGQHRLWGYRLSTKSLRVPVVIYNDLTRAQEARLFIDINTKQKPVSKELLLAINKLANRESDVESQLGAVYDLFESEQTSALLGRLSPTKASNNAITRVTFNAAIKPILSIFEGKTTLQIYELLNPYLHAVHKGLRKKNIDDYFVSKTVFRAFLGVFKDVAHRVRLSGPDYSADAYGKIIRPFFELKPSVFEKASNHKKLMEQLSDSLSSGFKF